MTEGRFKELVNLYLDHEISPRDFHLLRQELAIAERKQQFEALRRIHIAEKQVLAQLCGDASSEHRRCGLAKRATRAINDARVQFEERRKGLVLMVQFSAATAAVAVTVSVLYQDSVQALDVDVNDAQMAEAPSAEVRELFLANLQSPNSNSRLVIDQDGRALALISYQDQGDIQVQALQTVPESNIFSLGKVLESARPQMPDPSELLENRSPTIPARQLPGTAAPIVLVEDTQGAGAIVGFAY